MGETNFTCGRNDRIPPRFISDLAERLSQRKKGTQKELCIRGNEEIK